MSFKSVIILTTLSILTTLIISCSGSDSDEVNTTTQKNSLKDSLKDNSQWPIVLTGEIEIIDGGGYDEGEYMTWAVGSLITNTLYGEVTIYLDGNALVDAQVNIDEVGQVKVWLDQPRTQYGHSEYEIVRIEKM